MGSGKFWRRRLRSLISFLLLWSISTVHGAFAQSEAEGIEKLEAFLEGVHSLTADFEQELWTAEQELLQTDSGSLSLERPNRFRWSYEDPTELTIVADGTRLWIYDVELAQVTVTPFDDNLAASPAMLLSGDRAVREDYEVVDSYPLDGLDWVKLEPKRSSDFSAVSIGFSGTEPRRLELVDGLGQVTRIELDNLVLNPEISNDVFELEVPAGVDVVGGEG